MDKGIYTLILRSEGSVIRVGALGEINIPKGHLIYVGSAQGPGGLIRVNRHLMAAHDGRKPHWHIDYLVRDPSIRIIASISAATGEKLECRLADLIGGADIPKFGCSDCRCESHLFLRSDDPGEEIAEIFRLLGLIAATRRY
jgi:Uri superfamily endonuclease